MSPPSGDYCTCIAKENGSIDIDRYGSDEVSCSHCRTCDLLSMSACTSLVSPYDALPLSDSEKLRRIVIASVKGFSIGAGLKGGLSIFAILARFGRRKALASIR